MKAIAIDSKFAYAHHNLGNIYVTLGNYSEAKKHFNEAIKSNPNFHQWIATEFQHWHTFLLLFFRYG